MYLLIYSFFLAFALVSSDTGNHTLTVQVDGLKNDTGQLILALFDNEKDYLNKAVSISKLKISQGKALHNFSDLPVGQYSVSTFHDANSNGKLDKNGLGIPKEEYGFSNNSNAKFGPPSFEKAAFRLSQDKKIIIHIQ